MQDWWNATTINDYWRLWNCPVHKWMLRHVYFPALRAGVPRVWAGTLVFAVSAFFHELLVGLPLHMVRCWAFVGVMSQVRAHSQPSENPHKMIYAEPGRVPCLN